MAGGLAIHIVAGDDRHTEVLTQDRIRVGACDDCDLRVRRSTLPPNIAATGAPLLELTRTNGSYHITDFNRALELLHNGAPIHLESAIGDGDEVRVGASDFALQFFPLRALPVVINARRSTDLRPAPFFDQTALEASTTATSPATRRDDAKVFLREFTRELVREVSLTTKLLTLAIVVALVGGLLYIGFSLYKEVQFSRRLINDQRAQLDLMRQQVGQTNEQLSAVNRSNQEVIRSMSIVPTLRRDYGNGVCLISGTFIFVEPGTNRPLRYPELQKNEDGSLPPPSPDAPQLTPEGKGPIAEFESVGTGFYVGDGFVLTNRHVAQPWLADQRVQSMSSSVGARPRLKKLVAFFPDQTQPITLRFKQAAARDDLAVCTIDLKDVPPGVPALPLDRSSEAIAVGKQVVLMGYPSGPDRLLARLEEAEARSINTRCGAALDALLNCLADKKYIQPLTTSGHITDLSDRHIVYDASTAEGGSGAPLFGQSGRVIGINYAVFVENSASNLAVPVSYAVALLQSAGMKIAAPVEENKNANAPPNSARSAAITTTNTAR